MRLTYPHVLMNFTSLMFEEPVTPVMYVFELLKENRIGVSKQSMLVEENSAVPCVRTAK